MIKAELADVDSHHALVYSVGLIIANIFFVLSIWWNAFATIKATFSRSHVQVCAAYFEFDEILRRAKSVVLHLASPARYVIATPS